MLDARQEVFRTARDYFGAAARYWQAKRAGADMEAPTQELLGRSLFYRSALQSWMGEAPAPAKRRLTAVVSLLRIVSQRYDR